MGLIQARDCPSRSITETFLNYWQLGLYRMDVKGLRQKLREAKLVLGDIRETSRSFCRNHEPAPIGAVIFDLDFCSSTVAALKMFDADEKYRLPRVYCFFDDVIGSEVQLFNDYTGERLAMSDFNRTHDCKKISVAYYLVCCKVVQSCTMASSSCMTSNTVGITNSWATRPKSCLSEA